MVCVTSPFCPTETRLYENGKVIAQDFAYEQVAGLLWRAN